MLRSPLRPDESHIGDATSGFQDPLPSWAANALPRLARALLEVALPVNPTVAVEASMQQQLQRQSGGPLSFPISTDLALHVLGVVRRIELGGSGAVPPMLTKSALHIATRALLSIDGANEWIHVRVSLQLRVWLALRAAAEGVPVPPRAAALLARLCADAAVAVQSDDADFTRENAAVGTVAFDGSPAALDVDAPGIVVHAHVAGGSRSTSPCLLHPPTPERAALGQALALALIAVGRDGPGVLAMPVLVAAGAADEACRAALRRSWACTTLQRLLLGDVAIPTVPGEDGDPAGGSRASPPAAEALAAAEAVAAVLVLHGQAAAAAHLMCDALAPRRPASCPSDGDDTDASAVTAAASGATVTVVAASTATAAAVACGEISDAVFGACCERGLLLEAAALLSLRQHYTDPPSAPTLDVDAGAVRRALLLGAQARLLGDLLGLHAGINAALRGALVRSALERGDDGAPDGHRGHWGRRRTTLDTAALRAREPPVWGPSYSKGVPKAAALLALAAEVCPESHSLLAGAAAERVAAGGLLVLSTSIRLPAQAQGQSAEINDKGTSAPGPPALIFDARPGFGGFGFASPGSSARYGGGGWLAAAGRRQTSLLAAALPFGGPLSVEWHVDGPDPLAPVALAAGPSGQLLAGHFSRSVGALPSAPPRRQEEEEEGASSGGAGDAGIAPATATAALRLQAAAVALADAVASDARSLVASAPAGALRHPATLAALAALAAAGGQGSELAASLPMPHAAEGAGAPDATMQRCHDAVVQGVAAAVPAYSVPTLKWLLFHASPGDVLRAAAGGAHGAAAAAHNEEEAAAPGARRLGGASDAAADTGSAGGDYPSSRLPPAAPALWRSEGALARIHSTLNAYGNLLQLVGGGGGAAAAAQPSQGGGAGAGARTLASAAAAFWEMRARGLHPAGSTYAALLGAAGRQAAPGPTAALLGDMRLSGRLPLGGGGAALPETAGRAGDSARKPEAGAGRA